MSETNAPSEMATAFVSLNEFLSSGGDREVALQKLVGLAVAHVPGCRWAAITQWPVGKQPRSLAVSGEIAAMIDLMQYEVGDGPCLTAAAESEMVHLADLRTDDRWPKFAAAMQRETPARAVLSLHLADHPHRSALNLYANEPNAFDVDSITTASLLAAHARVLLIHAASADKVSNLEHALTTSRQIGAAVGILMNVHKVTAEQAFDLLRVSSQNLNRKLHDVADEVTQTGALPE